MNCVTHLQCGVALKYAEHNFGPASPATPRTADVGRTDIIKLAVLPHGKIGHAEPHRA